ncbi:hypothetical protein GQX73_g1995 [Xylaria multiplex]|uniref:Uncharacterized protein n=1 Tax=Xylaria multiplex TaxID=323545 RepID=A0A7C8IW87_9PEZI|nr:hypothetical protein GQX73_g1995 [Xylaria multiplex]
MDNSTNCSYVEMAAVAMAREASINYQFTVLSSILGIVVFFWLIVSIFFIHQAFKPSKRFETTGPQAQDDIELPNRNNNAPAVGHDDDLWIVPGRVRNEPKRPRILTLLSMLVNHFVH